MFEKFWILSLPFVGHVLYSLFVGVKTELQLAAALYDVDAPTSDPLWGCTDETSNYYIRQKWEPQVCVKEPDQMTLDLLSCHPVEEQANCNHFYIDSDLDSL